VAPGALDAAQVVRELAPMLRRILGTNIALDLEIAEGPQTIWMDSGQLTQVLLNLVTNARDATTGAGRVIIRVSSVGPAIAAEELVPADWVRLEVEDTGHGMDAATQERIFEPYFTTKQSAQGTGLGLAVLMGALKSAGGEVRVKSEVGRGSRFRIMLPPSEPPRIGVMASSVE
jgi:two-component system cell cycle sensor histidine kinase/response regulator CckA